MIEFHPDIPIRIELRPGPTSPGAVLRVLFPILTQTPETLVIVTIANVIYPIFAKIAQLCENYDEV